VAGVRSAVREHRLAERSIGLVPTMGALHEGHLSLLRRARAECDVVVVSLFVNPAQFDEATDLAAYPRDEARDANLAAAAGADILFAPPVDEVYPPGFSTSVHVAGVSEPLEGANRGASHFDGVATVVTKLFGIVGPSTAYFGKKDAQQLAVVRRLVTDLFLPVEVVGCPLVREADGLAMSSRNRNLSPAQREAATVIHRGLQTGAAVVAGGERDAAKLRRVVANVLTTEPLVRLEYAEVVAADTLAGLEVLDGDVLVAVAARVGDVRLIDNMTIRIDAPGAVVDLGVTVAPTGEGLCAAR
jgi:pantoate--beta-alanine ligase